MAMLESLSNVEPKNAIKILAAAASSQLGGGFSDSDGSDEEFKSEAVEVLSEVRRKLKLGNDQSVSARGRVAKYISDVIAGSVFEGKDRKDILASAGQAGRLPPSQYKIIQPDDFAKQFRSLGVRKTTIDRAIADPDDFEHLMVRQDLVDDGAAFSLFMKQMPGNKSVEPHWLLVQSFRNGIEQIVRAAWWIHPSIVDVSKSSRPLDVLMAFAGEFGNNIIILNNRAKFLHEFPIPVHNKEGEFTVSMNSDAPILTRQFSTFSWKKTKDLNSAIISLAYSINMTKYEASLKGIGAL